MCLSLSPLVSLYSTVLPLFRTSHSLSVFKGVHFPSLHTFLFPNTSCCLQSINLLTIFFFNPFSSSSSSSLLLLLFLFSSSSSSSSSLLLLFFFFSSSSSLLLLPMFFMLWAHSLLSCSPRAPLSTPPNIFLVLLLLLLFFRATIIYSFLGWYSFRQYKSVKYVYASRAVTKQVHVCQSESHSVLQICDLQ